MRSSELSYFGLREAPFSKEIDDSELWLPSAKQELVDDLEAALANRESVLLVGEPGVGKTCVLHALRHRLPQAGFRLTYCRTRRSADVTSIAISATRCSPWCLSVCPSSKGGWRCAHRSLLTRIHHRFLIEPATVDDTVLALPLDDGWRLPCAQAG